MRTSTPVRLSAIAVLLCSASAASATPPDPTEEMATMRRVSRVELQENDQRAIQSVRGLSDMLVIDGGYATARRGVTLYQTEDGTVFAFGGEIRDASFQIEADDRGIVLGKKGGDAVYIAKPRAGNQNSAWMMVTCECSGTAEEDCELEKTPTGELVLDKERRPKCTGDDCCKVSLMGVDGAMNTVVFEGVSFG